jgi:hypothetical protein
MTRTQKAIAAYLNQSDEKPERSTAQPKARPGDIIAVTKKELLPITKTWELSGIEQSSILNYINESPKANQHFWNYFNGTEKKSFVKLVSNMMEYV